MCLHCYDSLSPDAVSSYRHKDTMKKRRATGGFADRGESNPVFCTAQETRKSLSPPNLDEGREKYRGSSAGVKARRGVEHSDEARLPQSGNRGAQDARALQVSQASSQGPKVKVLRSNNLEFINVVFRGSKCGQLATILVKTVECPQPVALDHEALLHETGSAIANQQPRSPALRNHTSA